MTQKQMFAEILRRLDSQLPVGILRETEPQLEFPTTQIRCPEDAYNLLRDEMQGLQQEALVLICLNTKNYVTHKSIIFVGTLNASVIHPREVFKHAILESANSIMLVHQHPSGDPNPSTQDLQATRQMVEAGKLLDIPLLDHLIVGRDSYVSLKERQLM